MNALIRGKKKILKLVTKYECYASKVSHFTIPHDNNSERIELHTWRHI